MTFRQFVTILLARWKVAVGVFGLVIAATVILTLLAPRKYMASTSVMIDAKNDPVAGQAYPTQIVPGYISTQVDIASSLRVAQLVAKMLAAEKNADQYRRVWQEATGGQGDFTAWLADGLRNALLVSPSRESSVINIGINWSDPKLAAQLANAFARAYMDTSIELRVEPARQYAAWFDQRSKELRAELESRQKMLSDFQRDNGITGIDDRLDIESQRLAQLSGQLISVQSLRQDSQSRQRQATGDSQAISEVLQNPVISALKRDLLVAEARQESLLQRVGANHPDYEQVVADVQRLRVQINQETSRVARSLTNATQINLRRETEVEGTFEAQKQRVMELKDRRDAAAVLQNDVVMAQRNLDAVTQRLAQSTLESQSQQTNIVMLTPAIEPRAPSSPNKLHNLIIGLILGAFAGIAAALIYELIHSRIRSPEDFVRAVRVPLIGRIAPDDSERHLRPEAG